MTTMTTATTSDNLLTTAEAADRLGLKKQTLNEWRMRSVGPRFIKLGRAVRYRASDLTEYIESQAVEPRRLGDD